MAGEKEAFATPSFGDSEDDLRLRLLTWLVLVLSTPSSGSAVWTVKSVSWLSVIPLNVVTGAIEEATVEIVMAGMGVSPAGAEARMGEDEKLGDR